MAGVCRKCGYRNRCRKRLERTYGLRVLQNPVFTPLTYGLRTEKLPDELADTDYDLAVLTAIHTAATHHGLSVRVVNGTALYLLGRARVLRVARADSRKCVIDIAVKVPRLMVKRLLLKERNGRWPYRWNYETQPQRLHDLLKQLLLVALPNEK